MSKFLCITVRFLQPLAHGRGDGGEPEWPPSPLRVFQALVNAAAARWNERLRVEYAKPALEWLANQPPPTVVAAIGNKSDVKYRMYVPDNIGDKVAGAWKRGDPAASIADYRTEKDVRPTHLAGDAAHYLYSVTDEAEFAKHHEALVAAARSITHVGWGVDMVAGNAGEISGETVEKAAEAAKVQGEWWRPTPDRSGTPLRVPRHDTLDALMDKHTAFLNRLSDDGFRPVPPLTAFATVGYRRDTDTAERPVAVFEVHRPVEQVAAGAGRYRPFDPCRTPEFARTGDTRDPCGAVVLAGLVRHAAAAAAREQGWDDARVRSFVEGHGENSGEVATTDDRLAYLPLPSVTPLKIEAIRRVLVVGPPGADLARVRQMLNGRELFAHNRPDPVAMLAVGSAAERTVACYLNEARTWATVTPVVLPGFDDPNGIRKRLSSQNPAYKMTADEKASQLRTLHRRTCDLLLRAFEQAGVGPGLISPDKLERGEVELEWRDVGFLPGVDLARRYNLGVKQFPRYHVRVRFAQKVRGPLAIGAGRYRGMGLFVAADG